MAVGVDRLAEVALAVQQADADERQRHVAGRLHVVAGKDAEAARVDAERLVEAVLGAEVGDRAVERVGVLALEPVVGAVGHVRVEVAQDSRYSAMKFGSSSSSAQSIGPCEDRDRDCDSAPRPRPSIRLNSARVPGATPSRGCRRAAAGPRAGVGAGTGRRAASGRGRRSMVRDDTGRGAMNRFRPPAHRVRPAARPR